MKCLKRLFIVFCAVFVVMSVFAVKPASVEAATSYMVTKKQTKVKKAAKDSAGSLVTIPSGTVVKVTSGKSNGFYKVEYKNSKQKSFKGYVYASHLKKISGTKLVKADKIYSRKTVSSNVLLSLKKGTKVFVLSKGAAFYKVQYFDSKGKVYRGFVHKSAFTGKSNSAETAATTTKKSNSSSSSSSSSSGNKYKTTTTLNLRSGPTVDSEIVCRVKSGAVVTATAARRGWYYVTYTVKNNTYGGYLYQDYLTKVS